MKGFGNDEGVKIDQCHAALVYSLVAANKPTKILELGVGGGRSTDAILDALAYNGVPYTFVLVDNWFDFDGVMPQEVEEKYGKRLSIVSSDEKEYLFSTRETYDFIMSDADHAHQRMV